MKNDSTKLLAMARKAGAIAASEWESGDISLQDHRLLRLMSFERDIVQSTSDDTAALPLWSAFLDAFDNVAPSTSTVQDELVSAAHSLRVANLHLSNLLLMAKHAGQDQMETIIDAAWRYVDDEFSAYKTIAAAIAKPIQEVRT